VGIYIAFVCLAGMGLLIHLTTSVTFTWRLLTGFLFWAVLAIAMESLPLPLPYGGFVTLGFPIVYAVFLIYGPGVSSWIAICGAALGVGLNKRLPWYAILFNSSQLIISICAAWFVYRLTGGEFFVPVSIKLIFPIISSGFIYFLVNSFLVSGILSLQQKKSLPRMWKENFKWTVPNCLAQTPIGVMMALVYKEMSWWAVLFFILPLLLAYYAYKLYLNIHKEHFNIIYALSQAIETRDPYIENHSKRMANYAVAIAERLGFSREEIQTIQYAAILHDIGKLGVSEKILNKPGSLTPEEWVYIKKHPLMGAKILEGIDSLKEASRLIYYHHERYNGKGYPERLKGEDIPRGARILAVIDAYDAMISKRPYHPFPYSQEEAIEELKKNAGTQFDKRIVEIFLEIVKQDAH